MMGRLASTRGTARPGERARSSRVEKHFEKKKTLSTPDQDSSSYLPVIGSPVNCECDALDHAATEAGDLQALFELLEPLVHWSTGVHCSSRCGKNLVPARSVTIPDDVIRTDRILICRPEFLSALPTSDGDSKPPPLLPYDVTVRSSNQRIRKVIYSDEAYPHLRGRRVENQFEKHLGTPDRDSNLDLPVIGSLVYYKSSALDHEATEAVRLIQQDSWKDCIVSVFQDGWVDDEILKFIEECIGVMSYLGWDHRLIDYKNNKKVDIFQKLSENYECDVFTCFVGRIVIGVTLAIDKDADDREIVKFESRKCTRVCVEAVWKTDLSAPDRDLNLDLPVIASLVYCESSAIDHAATEAGDSIRQFEKFTTPTVIEQVSYILIAAGAFVFVVSFLGYCGAIRESRCLLTTYGVLLLIILVMEITAGGLAAAYKKEAETESRTMLKNSIKKYYATQDKADAVTLMWNYFMAQMKCCAVDNYLDFKESPKWGTNKTVPEACCVLVGDLNKFTPKDPQCPNNPSESNSYYMKGCYETFYNWLMEHINTAIGVGIGLGLLQLLGIFFAFCLCKSIDGYIK
uniref:Tetraspanin n=1 Tax=Timema genevievae TaxID=629358 RepID=A0A7R9JQU7_TIMGE|nr:unnamed protein product [Timema genevievae]